MQIINAFSELLKFNAGYLAKSLEKIPTENFFVRPEKRGNPLIWLLGHVVVNRGEIIEILGGNPAIGNLIDLFARDTVPQSDSSIYPKPKQLIARFMKMASITDHLFKKCDPGMFDSKSRGDFDTVGQNIAYSYMHETHHIGQIAYIINLPGIKPSKKSATIFKKPQTKNSTAKILIENIKSVFS